MANSGQVACIFSSSLIMSHLITTTGGECHFFVSSIMSHPMTDRKWATIHFSLSTVSSFSSNNQDGVSEIAFLLPDSLINMSCPMTTGSEWQCIFFFARHSHQSCLIQWPTECKWHYTSLCLEISSIMSQPMTNSQWVIMQLIFPTRQFHHFGCLTNREQVIWHFVSLPGSLINMTNSLWVALLFCFARQPQWSCLIHDQQAVSDNAIDFSY